MKENFLNWKTTWLYKAKNATKQTSFWIVELAFIGNLTSPQGKINQEEYVGTHTNSQLNYEDYVL